MDVFALRDRLVADYANYTRSFIKIADPRIRRKVDTELDAGAFWPEPLLQLNPAFEPGGTIDDLVSEGVLHEECARIFRLDKTDADPAGRQLPLYAHQAEAIRKARARKSYVLTSGTGSGKSLTYIVPIVDHVLRRGSGNGIQAIIVYPMNALANSQNEELAKFLGAGYGDGESPVRFARYTGQEKESERREIRTDPPDILLTNYMMLELLLTRGEDRELVRAARGLRFLVLDELHTYRGRQGADVALLIRRCRLAVGGGDMICVGTSATMASGRSAVDRKREVAAVAATLFGDDVTPDRVIEETLERSTLEFDPDDPATRAALTTAVSQNREPPDNYDAFRGSPLASWIESAFGIRTEPETGQLVRQSPRPLRGPTGAVEDLAALTSADRESCATVLRRYLLKGSGLRAGRESRFPMFAFRLHQFFTRGDTVWTTLEPESVRHIEIAKLGSKPGEPDKLLFPLVFCRHCGAEYYRVALCRDGEETRLEPREERGDLSGDSVDAWLYASEEAPWPSATEERLARLPAFMKELTTGGRERVRADARKDVPKPVFVDAVGRIAPEGEGLGAALVTKNFLFCLNPDCGVAWARTQRSEKAKLGTLGVDSRSTATTILAVRSLVELQGAGAPADEPRKLLSFTDNRQDASLQAGHFNDFTQIALLRSALYKAALSKGAEGLEHGALARSVFQTLRLRFEEYAADPDVRGPARQATDDALCRAIDYFLYRDLKRGWRVTAPNLEDCGLLEFEYQGLTGADGLLGEKELWEEGFASGQGRDREYLETPPALRSCDAPLREEILRTLLDVLRQQLAIEVDALDPGKQQELVRHTKPRLLEGTVWCLDDPGELAKSTVAWPRARRGRDPREDKTGFFVSSRGALGRYVWRRLAEYADAGRPFGREDVDRTIRFLFGALARYGILERVRSPDGYRINPGALRWVAGDGETRPHDRTRLLEVGEIPARANRYFLECYRSFVDVECLLEAREHTAQVASEDREEREARFREGGLPLLFCSPTMELGVDIAQLNLVNLRNVPPTPANYAQRSGRAGRSGQPALVYTYCAGRSPHDQYYYGRPGDMVSGSVTPPRIDLCNRDLVRSHIHAIWTEMANPDFGPTLTSLLDVRHEDGAIRLPVKTSIRRSLDDPALRAAALKRADRLIESIRRELKSATWFREDWVGEILNGIVRSFEAACNRWRGLYRAAVRQRELHHRIIGDTSRPEAERARSRRLRAQAESQIRLLTEAEGVYRGDFYSWRYLAAEGFLPGYNFPRLPLSAYVPGRRLRTGSDEFISRPRFLAISEFGPRALIYHEGSRYRAYKVNLDFGSDEIESAHNLPTATMKRCSRCGYAHVAEGVNLTEVCERCGAGLNEESLIGDLVRMQNVSLRSVQRITCDEEERQRFGYRLVSAYRFPETGGKMDRNDSEAAVDGVRVMRLSYGDATDLYRINLGWAKRRPDQPDGFVLDLEKGYWARNEADGEDRDDPTADGRKTRVVPYVIDTRNVLVVAFEPLPDRAEMAALQAAFREAIRKRYQLEPRELSAEAMPTPDDRREILFYEAAEGGAGVLRQLVDDPGAIPALARRALEICHFDPDTLDDLKADACGKACYECLLDYGNQPDHMLLDRHAIRDSLAELARSTTQSAGGPGARTERLAALRKACDSKLELRWLDRLDALGLRLPSDAQLPIEACSTRPDFFYRDYNAAVYIDGPPHDGEDRIRDDEAITERLMDAGYAVLRFHHGADWDGIFRRHPDIFGTANR